MKVYCAWCFKLGVMTLVGEKPDCDEPGDSYGGCCPSHLDLAVKETTRVRQHTLTTADVAKRLGICHSRVLAIIRAGNLPAKKFRRQWMVSELDLARYRPKPVGRPKIEKGHKKE